MLGVFSRCVRRPIETERQHWIPHCNHSHVIYINKPQQAPHLRSINATAPANAAATPPTFSELRPCWMWSISDVTNVTRTTALARRTITSQHWGVGRLSSARHTSCPKCLTCATDCARARGAARRQHTLLLEAGPGTVMQGQRLDPILSDDARMTGRAEDGSAELGNRAPCFLILSTWLLITLSYC